MRKKNIYILGVGNNTEVYIDLVEECGFTPAGLYHYEIGREGELLHNVPILDCNENLFKQDLTGKLFAISVGDNLVRKDLAEKILKGGGEIPTLIHPTAVVSKYAKISAGVVIHAKALIQAGAIIGSNTVISYNASVTHTSTVGKSCYLAANAHIGAYCNIGNNVLLGQGAILISGKVPTVGDNSIIGAGSVVTKSIAENTIVTGNPARTIKSFKINE